MTKIGEVDLRIPTPSFNGLRITNLELWLNISCTPGEKPNGFIIIFLDYGYSLTYELVDGEIDFDSRLLEHHEVISQKVTELINEWADLH